MRRLRFPIDPQARIDRLQRDAVFAVPLPWLREF